MLREQVYVIQRDEFFNKIKQGKDTGIVYSRNGEFSFGGINKGYFG